MSLRVSPISRTAAVLIIVIGVFTLLFVDPIAGAAFVLLGVFLYGLLYKFRGRVERELDRVESRRSD